MSKKITANMIEVDPLEIVFFYRNADGAIKQLIYTKLKDQYENITRHLVVKELTKLKPTYNEAIIQEARRVIKEFKHVEFESNKFVLS